MKTSPLLNGRQCSWLVVALLANRLHSIAASFYLKKRWDHLELIPSVGSIIGLGIDTDVDY